MPLVLFFSPGLDLQYILVQSTRGIATGYGRGFKHSYFDGLRSQWSQLSYSAALRK